MNNTNALVDGSHTFDNEGILFDTVEDALDKGAHDSNLLKQNYTAQDAEQPRYEPRMSLNYVYKKIKLGTLDEQEMIEFMVVRCKANEFDKIVHEFKRLINFQEIQRRLKIVGQHEEFLR